ncbi:ankyrin repeat domain-containing protein 26 [Python bivittatus]|uniref:Ankyrin repeat domain-containing protein 26 n=1 Tax=Python bivittatus TaxID=176946 RepID=A0A9F3W0T5_PYTBI|nr:ankyrin repeat domain-containing protein 26 [Python bivittatus]
MKAVQCQQEFCAVYLLEHGADPNLKDIHNNTALHFAAFNSSISIAKYLLEHNAHIEAQNKDGSTPLIVAVGENNREMVEFLLKKKASVDATDKLGRTPLLISASNKKRDLTSVLLVHGSNVSHRDESGWSAKDYAMISDDPILIQCIADYANWKHREEDSFDGQKVLSILSSPEKDGDTGITLGAPATNKEVLDNHSSGDSVRNSEKTDDDSWLSSEEEELGYSPKKAEKPSLAQLMKVAQDFKKKYNENENQTKENIKIYMQKKSNPIKQELNDSDSSFASSEEEEFDGKKREEKKKEEEEEEKVKEMEENFSTGREEANVKEIWSKAECKEDETVDKLEGKEHSTANEHEWKANLFKSSNEICSVGNEVVQDGTNIPESFIPGHSESLHDHAVINKVNKELPEHSIEKEYNYEDQFQNLQKFQDTENNNKMSYENQKKFCKNVFSLENVGKATLSSFPTNSHDNGMDSILDDIIESYDVSGSEAELKKHTSTQQNIRNPDFAGYQNTEEKQYVDSKELEEAIYEPTIYKLYTEDKSLKTSHSNLKAKSSKDEEDGEQEDQNISDVTNKKNTVNRQSWNLSPKAKSALGMDKDEEGKGTESPWDSECTSESPRKPSVSPRKTAVSPRKPAISSLPTSPAKTGIHIHSITEELYNGKPGLQPKITKKNLVRESPAPVLKEAIREKQKSDLMEELGLDDADDIEDASDWDSTSISLKSTPYAKPANILMLEDHASPRQLAETNVTLEISVPVKEDSNTQTVISSKGHQYNEHKSIKEFESNSKEKCLLDTSSSIETSTHEKQTDKAEIEYAHDEKTTEALIHSEESHNESSRFDSTHWEERYEKMWVANEKKEVKANFKSITAELKQMFGEINVYEKISNTSSKGRSQDGFCCATEGIKETSLHLQKIMDIQGKGDIRDVRSVTAERELNTDDWNTNKNLLSNNAIGTKPNISEERSNNTIIQLRADVSETATASEKHLECSVQSHEDITKDTIFKTIDAKQPIITNNLYKHFSVTKNPSEETEYHFNNSINSCKDTDIEIGNKVKYHNRICPQISKKSLDEELENDVARFKNEVGILHSVFLVLEKEKTQLQKEIEEEKIKKELELEGRKIANAEKLAVSNDEKVEEKHSISEIQHMTAESVFSADRKEVICPSLKDTRKSENKRRNSKQRIDQQLSDNLHQPQDDSSLSEASLEERYPAKSVNGKNKLYRALSITNDLDDLTPSSDSTTEDIELPSSIYKEAIVLIEQLSFDSKDSVSLLKIQNIFHGYERLIELEKGRYTQLLEKVKKLEDERNEWQKILEEMTEMKSILDHKKVEYESDVTSLRFSLKQEEEKRMSAEMLYEKNQEQLRKKEEQYCTQMEEKQQLELMLRSLEIELKTLKNHLKQVEEERNETQRQLCQEQNARALQEDILNTHFWRQKELEEESKKVATKSPEMTDNHDHEKELLHRNQILQDELAVLKLELDHIRIRHQEEESKYLEENETLKEKNEELKKELKLNEEALTQTVFQYNGQISVSKTEIAMVTSKLEHTKENKERLEVELDSLRSRLSSAVQELDRSQITKNDLERLLQREHDEWLRSKDKLNHEICTLREANSSMSQQLGKAESKANSLENELHHVTHNLREKNLLLDSIQRELNQAQCQVKEQENAQQIAKDQINKYVIKLESMQERLAQLQSENLLFRQQFEDFQNKGIIKEKVVTDVQDRFNDIFNKLRADTEKQIQMMEERNKELITKCNNLKDQVIKYETEKIDRESAVRQLQQELADSLKKQSMSEASLEVSTRYRIDLEEDKQQLLKEIERIKCKLQESEEQNIQYERSTHELRHALDAKEHDAIVASQKLQDLLVASSGASNAIKQLEEHIQRLEIENARLEATTNQQTNRIETLQKDLQDSASVHNRLEELITGLQTAKISLEEQLNHQVQKENMLSVTAQDAHNMWEEELKLKSKLGVRLSELDREKTELISQFENEKKKVKKVLELKRSMEIRLDQEMKRNSELQKEYHGIKKLLKTAKKKLKDYESGESSSQVSLHGEIKNKYSEIDIEIGKLRKKVDELSRHLEVESTRCTQLESTNCELHEQLSSMKILHKNHEKLERSKLQLEEEVANLKRQVQGNLIDLNQVEQYKREIEERARQEIRQKLEEVNFFLQTQAASQETLEQIRATSNASLRNQLENRIRDLESELGKLKNSQQDNILQKESTHTELEKYKGLYSEELKIRRSLGSKLDRANEKLAEANAKLIHERHKSKSLLANSFISGSLSSNPVLETVQIGNLGSNLALNRSLSLGGGFLNTSGTALASKNRVEAYLAKMQIELEKSITKELDQAKAELDAGSVRVSPVGSVDGSSKNPNKDQDQVSKATQQYLDVLKKNYMI